MKFKIGFVLHKKVFQRGPGPTPYRLNIKDGGEYRISNVQYRISKGGVRFAQHLRSPEIGFELGLFFLTFS